jgi:hypothetical protein
VNLEMHSEAVDRVNLEMHLEPVIVCTWRRSIGREVRQELTVY